MCIKCNGALPRFGSQPKGEGDACTRYHREVENPSQSFHYPELDRRFWRRIAEELPENETDELAHGVVLFTIAEFRRVFTGA